MNATMRFASTWVLGLAVLVGGQLPASGHESSTYFHLESAGECTNCSGTWAGDPFHWDFIGQYTWSDTLIQHAAVWRGTGNAFAECMRVSVNGTIVEPDSYSMHADGRGFTTAEFPRGSIRITRDVWVPEDGLDFARWVDAFENTASTDTEIDVTYYCQYIGCGGYYYYYYYYGAGGDAGDGAAEGLAPIADDCTVGSADGDESSDKDDTWIAWNDGDGSGYPSAGIVTHGDGADIVPSSLSYNEYSGAFILTFNDVPVAAGSTVKLLLFLVQGDDSEAAVATASELSLLPNESIVGLDPLPDLENFVTDGRPAVSAGGPYDVAEGGEIYLEARILDREGDPYSFEWDLDGDGVFGEAEIGELEENPLFSAADIDGPADADVAIEVTEVGGLERMVSRGTEVDILNVAPIIVSEPPHQVKRGALYSYQPTVVDPAPAASEPLTYELVDKEFPVGMAIDEAGLVTWTPTPEQLGKHEVSLTVEDDDHAEFTQSWIVTVIDNDVPGTPQLLYPTPDTCVVVERPTIKVTNAIDPDGDTLRYYFELDSDAGFQSADRQVTAADGLPEGTTGFTEWQIPRPLGDQQKYYWRAWVTDGVDESDRITQFFETCFTPEPDEGDDGSTEEDAGCACRTGSQPGAGSVLAFVTGIGAIAIFRRRRG